jgi:hypothetical protein
LRPGIAENPCKVTKEDQVLTQRSDEFPLDDQERKTRGSFPENDRAIELSERSHVEIVLYARGLELERDRLLQLIRSVHEQLGALVKTAGVSPQMRGALQRLAKTLEKNL